MILARYLCPIHGIFFHPVVSLILSPGHFFGRSLKLPKLRKPQKKKWCTPLSIVARMFVRLQFRDLSKSAFSSWGIILIVLYYYILIIVDACYDRGVPLFSNTTPRFGSLRPLPKNGLEENKTATGWQKIPWGLGTPRESCYRQIAYCRR